MIRYTPITLVILALLSGCTTTASTTKEQSAKGMKSAVDSLNKQIEEFNANRIPNMGITPIDRRVSRVEYDSKTNQVNTFDQDGKLFIVLKREQDGRFKGVLEQPYHQLAFSGPDGSHSWGHILAEFYIEKGMF